MINYYSIHFIIFIVIALLCYYRIFKQKQWICILLASIYFYYWTGLNNFIFIFLTGTSTWLGALALERLPKKEKKVRKLILWGIIFLNFSILAYIKYANLLFPSRVTGIILPLGISFYMFQSIGYLIDVYYRKYSAERNFAKYILFVAYFPQMIQGPINRYDAISVQLMEKHSWNAENATKAMYRIAYGLFKKYAIANVYVGIIKDIFDTPGKEYAGSTILFGILLYSLQQYADFSGGIDMVLGVSELFGIHMAENFKQPYFASSLGDFWRRWHISLGKWMRDYVFYPFALTKPMKKMGKWANKRLGKHMGRVLPAAVGNMLVFFLVGLWHGAEWHYIIWGLYNGFIIAFSDILTPLFGKVTALLKLSTNARSYRVFQVIRTFIIVNIGWYFDRITDVKEAIEALKRTIFCFKIDALKLEVYILTESYARYLLIMSIIACFFVFTISLLEEKKMNVRDYVYVKPLPIRWILYIVVIGFIIIASGGVKGAGGFMYANF